MKTLLVTTLAFLSFAGAAAAATAPTVSTSAATSVSASGATLNGSVNPNGESTTWYFEYGQTNKYGTKTPVQSAGSGTTALAVSATVAGLQTGKLYHYRLVATSDGGTSQGADQTFTPVAVAAAPTVTTDAASGVTGTGATLNGTLNPNGQASSWYFEYGPNTGYGVKTAVKTSGTGTRPTSVSASVSSLAAGTTYHFRLVATNGTGTTQGADQSFTTAGPPAVITGMTMSVTPTSATLTGSVNPLGRGTTWRFEYGTTTAYGSKTPNENAGSGNSVMGVSAALTGLTQSTTYHYRLVATSNVGTSNGADATFTTLSAITMQQAALRVLAGHYVTLSGTAGTQAGTTVTILAEQFGASSFTQIAAVLTGGGGSWSYLARPTIRTMYEATANGGTSSQVTLGVQPAVSLRLITGHRFSTRVSAGTTSFGGKLVQFQRMSGDHWVTLKRQRLGSSSTTTFNASLLPHGTSMIRVALSVNQAGPGYLGGLSRTLTYRR